MESGPLLVLPLDTFVCHRDDGVSASVNGIFFRMQGDAGSGLLLNETENAHPERFDRGLFAAPARKNGLDCESGS